MKSQLGLLFPTIGENKKMFQPTPNHQSDRYWTIQLSMDIYFSDNNMTSQYNIQPSI